MGKIPQDLVRRHAKLAGSSCQIDVPLITVGQRVYRFSIALMFQLGVKSRSRFCADEPGTVGFDEFVHILFFRIERLHRFTRFSRQQTIVNDVTQNFIRGVLHALVMAPHAGNAVGYRQILARRIAHDIRWAFV